MDSLGNFANVWEHWELLGVLRELWGIMRTFGNLFEIFSYTSYTANHKCFNMHTFFTYTIITISWDTTKVMKILALATIGSLSYSINNKTF